MATNIVARYGKIAIEESCGHFYPTFNGDYEFKTLKQARMWVLFEYLPRLRFLAQCDAGLLDHAGNGGYYDVTISE
jgi:hypothetical protein